MRDLTESHAAYGRAMLADLTRPDAGPGKPVDGDSADPAAQVYVEDGTGRVRAPRSLAELRQQVSSSVLADAAAANLAATWDAALAIVRAAPPMPLESSDPWCEDDDAYRTRLADRDDDDYPNTPAYRWPPRKYGGMDGSSLDDVGRHAGLSRARLVRVTNGDGK